MYRGAEWAWKDRRVVALRELHVVSLKVELGEEVQCWPVRRGGVNGLVSQTVKQFGYPKFND